MAVLILTYSMIEHFSVEIERCLKKIAEGVEIFDETWQKVSCRCFSCNLCISFQQSSQGAIAVVDNSWLSRLDLQVIRGLVELLVGATQT